MKAYSPNGTLIVGTKETIPGQAIIAYDSFRKKPNGKITFGYDGETTVFWDDQKTVLREVNGVKQKVFLDENLDEWTEDQLVLADDEEDSDA